MSKAQETSHLSSSESDDLETSKRQKKLPLRYRDDCLKEVLGSEENVSSSEEKFSNSEDEDLESENQSMTGKQSKCPVVPSFPELEGNNMTEFKTMMLL